MNDIMPELKRLFLYCDSSMKMQTGGPVILIDVARRRVLLAEAISYALPVLRYTLRYLITPTPKASPIS
jgi:hypothetical protein